MIFSTLPVRYKYSALLFLGLGIVVCSQICCKSPSASKNWSGAIQILREQRLVCILLCYFGVCAARLMLSIGEYGMLERACAKLNQYIFSTCARSTLLTLHSSANSSAAWEGVAVRWSFLYVAFLHMEYQHVLETYDRVLTFDTDQMELLLFFPLVRLL